MYKYKSKVLKVVDGDTLDAMIDLGFDTWVKKRIRLADIDAYEPRTRDKEEKVKGLAAKERLQVLLNEVSSKPGYFRIKSHGVGKYGRVLGQIFIMDKDGKQWDINETLVTEGHGYIYDGGTKKTFTS